MKIGLTEPKEVKFLGDVLKLLGAVNEEMSLNITKENITAISMDNSHIAMIDMKVNKNAFGEYIVDEDLLLSFNINELRKRLDTVDLKEERVSIQHDPEIQKILLDIINPETQRKRKLKLSLLEPLNEEVPKPKIVFQGLAKFGLDDLEQAVKDAAMVSEHMVVKIFKEGEADKLTFDARGDMGDSFLEVNIFDKFKAGTEEAQATYTTSWLAGFVGAIKPLAKQITIEMSTDMPMKLTLSGNSKLTCDLFLAPCIS